MPRITGLSAAERDLVTAAVTAAETGTDGEIMTIVSRRSDAYHDVALHYAVLAMLIAVALVALYPGAVEAKLALLSNGWGEGDHRALPFLLLITQAIVFLVVRYALAWAPLRMALTPKATRHRRVRRRAVQYFKVGAERRTQARVGILLYLSLDERIAEIVADEAIHGKVPPERWGDAMAALIAKVREGRPGEGMAAAVTSVNFLFT